MIPESSSQAIKITPYYTNPNSTKNNRTFVESTAVDGKKYVMKLTTDLTATK